MRFLKNAALSARATLLAPLRQTRSRKLAEQGALPISVLFYHRVADSNPTDWTISCDQFRRHVDYCQQSFELVDLAEVQRRVREKDSSTPAVSITFDDGYQDNCEFALPLLIERGIPCTYFVTTSNIRNQTPFSHDQHAGKPLAVNTIEQIREASGAGIEIGCHTRHHVDFSRIHDPEVIRQEIIEAKDELQQMIGKSVRYFAFPYGLPQQLTQMAIETVHEAGFEGFCSAYGAYNLVGRDAFHLRRCHGDPQFSRLVNWLSLDPTKLRREPDVRYFLPPHRSFDQTLAITPEYSSPSECSSTPCSSTPCSSTPCSSTPCSSL